MRGMKTQEAKLMGCRAMFFLPAGGCSLVMSRMKGDVSSWTPHSFNQLLADCKRERRDVLRDTPAW